MASGSESGGYVSPEVLGEAHVEGGTIRYRIDGEGDRALLLLHGGPGASCHYLKPLERLADGRRVVFYDQLGGGLSDRPGDRSLWRIERFLAEVETLRQHLDLEQFDLFGHSWGGMLAIEYALAHQERLNSLVLASTIASSAFLREELARLRSQLPADLQETLHRHEQAGTTDSTEYQQAMSAVYRVYLCRVDPWPPEVVRSFDELNLDVYGTMWGPSEFFFMGNLADWTRLEDLHKIRVPTLITVGEYDELTPACARQMHDRISGSKLVVFPNCSHLAFYEDAEAYLRTVDEFLRSV